jgi:hypothetical protein
MRVCYDASYHFLYLAIRVYLCAAANALDPAQGGLPLDWGVMSTPAMSALRSFSCARCGLSGQLPSWGDASACNGILERFDVSGNALTGAVPVAMEGWLNLQHFDVSTNQLTGVFASTTHCNLEALVTLRVARNNLTGPIPTSEWLAHGDPQASVYQLCMCCCRGHACPAYHRPYTYIAPGPAVHHHNLTQTCESGLSLPALCHSASGWGSFTALSLLDASFNSFTGAVPDFLPNTLQQLYLDHNALNGSVPAAYGVKPMLYCWSLDNNPGVCGELQSGTRCFNRANTSIGACALLHSCKWCMCSVGRRAQLHVQDSSILTEQLRGVGTCKAWQVLSSVTPLMFAHAAGLDCSTQQPRNATVSCSPTPATAQCDASRMPAPTPDTAALLAWKATVTNMPSGPLMGWSGSDACTWGWVGVECNTTTGRVVGLRLKGMQLTVHGPINWQPLTNLTALRFLELPVSCRSCQHLLFWEAAVCLALSCTGHAFHCRILHSCSALRRMQKSRTGFGT